MSASAHVGSPVRIRLLTHADLPRVMQIENDSFSVPWSATTFQGLLRRSDADMIAAEREDRLVGYAIAWTVIDQAEIGNVAIDRAARGGGMGRLLVESMVERLRLRGVRECFLEVRESNTVAQELYRSCGFEAVGRRRGYYNEPVEDALVMRLRLAETA